MMLLAALLLVQSNATMPDPALAPVKPIAELPRDVQRHIRQYGDCQHWLGEEPTDDARRAQIAAGVRKACRNIDASGAKLRQRYAANAGVTAALVAYPPLEISAN